MTAGPKAYQLRTEDEASLLQNLQRFKKELLELRTTLASNGSAAKAGRIRICRSNIARVLTIITEKRITQARNDWARKRRVPRDLKPKLTRRLRRRMTPEQMALVPLKVAKRRQNFPDRRIAIRK